MKIGLACGGTGGHIFPGLATADVLRKRGHEVCLWLAGKDVEEAAISGWKGEVVTVPAEGFPSKPSFRSLVTATRLLRAARTCSRKMRSNRPDALLAMGSYASAGPVSAALRLHVPVVLHEANVLPGRAVSLFSRWATAMAASFEETRYYTRRKNLVITGMPMRSGLDPSVRGDALEGLDRNVFTVLVMGGSRGAHRLNEIASEVMCRLKGEGRRLQVIHLAGVGAEQEVKALYDQAGVPSVVYCFTHDMGPIYHASDIAVCRSGASTCAELLAYGVPALLVPYPFAAHDHQTANARALERADACDVVPERDLSVEWLSEYLMNCLDEPGRLARMSAAAKKRAMPNGAEALADLVEQVGSGLPDAG